jgi:ComF family protein
MKTLKKIYLQTKNFFFPGVCALCADALITDGEIQNGLCEKCAAGFRNTQEKAGQGGNCNLCGKPLISEIENCLICRNGGQRSYERLWVLFSYIGKYRQLLTEYKFKKNLSLAGFFAEQIMEVIQSFLSSEYADLKDAVIVPVPPRPGKIKESGWDQVECLVKQLEKIRGCPPVCRCLKRRKSKVQKSLTRTERLKNLKGRIYLNSPAPKIALIIDDVLTTGSTMEVCASVLKTAGAQKVYGLCLFYD